jgi:hypothetical protein
MVPAEHPADNTIGPHPLQCCTTAAGEDLTAVGRKVNMQGILVCLLAYVWFDEGCVVRWLWLRQLRQCWHAAAEANHGKHTVTVQTIQWMAVCAYK